MVTRELCLITGASRGIGSAIAVRLARPDRVVFINHRASHAAAARVRDAARRAGGLVEVTQADISVRAEVDEMMRQIAAAGPALGILVHNAAAPLLPKRVQKLDWEADVLPAIAVACGGLLNCVQAAGPLLVSGSRLVVLLTDALFRRAPAQMGAYLAAKGALWGLTRSLATELQPRGVRVHAVSPGMTRTDLWKAYDARALEILAQARPRGRLAEPDEVAALVEAVLERADQYPQGANVFTDDEPEKR